MTDALDRDDVRAFLEVGPGMRGKLERALDALMDLLDGLEDPDLEETGDDEPDADTEASLGAPNEARSQERWGDGTPAMAWDADREGPEDELEPSLGSIGSCGSVYADQRGWARGADTEAEGDEHDGREPDEADEEPELGATVTLNQERAWAPQSDRRWYTTDGEPSLGWSNGRGHPEAAMRGYDDDREEDHEREHDHAERGVADQDALSIELAEGGGHINDGDQRVPLFVGESVTEEARRMESLVKRSVDHVVRIRQAGDPQPEPLPGVIDVIGPADAGEFARLTGVR